MNPVSLKKGENQVNLALLTDGLRAEREQGITIDVAYRYFATPKRKFINWQIPQDIFNILGIWSQEQVLLTWLLFWLMLGMG